MPSIPPPHLPFYRITLFYGPEAMVDDPSCMNCVFNVKKRSWKGGVQISVEIEEAQLVPIRQRLGFDTWLKTILGAVPDAQRDEYEHRADDLFTQEICSVKLSLLLESDIRQENSRIESRRFVEEVDRVAVEHGDRIKSNILMELDLKAS